MAVELLQGACEHSCLKLNLLYDGGFRDVCDETTATNDWPFCDGDPVEDDLFHMRQCILTCRMPLSADCPNIHERGNDQRGCEAGQAFMQGLPYEFITAINESVVFQSLVTAAPSVFLTRHLTDTPTDLPTRLPASLPTGLPTSIPTGLPTSLLTSLPTGSINPTATTLMEVLLRMAVTLLLLLVALLIRGASRYHSPSRNESPESTEAASQPAWEIKQSEN